MNKEYQCQCITCKHIREMEKLIPDDTLRNKVLAVTDGLYEAMAGENNDREMEIIRLNKLLSDISKGLDVLGKTAEEMRDI